MRSAELAKRNLKEVWRDPLSLALTVILPIAMLLVLQPLGDLEDAFTPSRLAPGIVLFGFVMLMFSSAMILARDRDTALFSRLLTTPLRAGEFVTGYSLPYVPVALVQALVLFGIAALLGMQMHGSALLIGLVLLLMAVFYISWGLILGASFTANQVPFAYMVILMLTIFGGAWMDLEAIGGMFQRVGDVFPFAHAMYAARHVMIDGAGFDAIAGDLVWVLAYTVVSAALAVVAFQRRMSK